MAFIGKKLNAYGFVVICVLAGITLMSASTAMPFPFLLVLGLYFFGFDN